MKKKILLAFSLVELMVTLIVVSCIVSALAPVITKKLSSNAISIQGGSGGGGNIYMDCSAFGESCNLCYPDRCITCLKSCASNQALNIAQCKCENCSGLFGAQCKRCDMSSCSECAVGYYIKNGKCEPCATGNKCDGTTSSTCPKGYYCENGNAIPCPAGTYNNTTGASSAAQCLPCIENCAQCESTTGACNGCLDGYSFVGGNCVMNKLTYTYDGSYSEEEKADGTIKLTFKTSGTFTPTATKKVTLFLVGGGGAGGQSGGSSAVCGWVTGSPGCGADTNQTVFTLSQGTNYAVTIGAGGSGRDYGCWQKTCCFNGGAGGTTKFGSLSAGGGKGGNSCESQRALCPGKEKTFDGITYCNSSGGGSNTGNATDTNKGDGGSGVVVMLIPK